MSRVQVLALEMLMIYEEAEHHVDHRVRLFNDVRAALVARGAELGEMYPEFTRQEIATEDAAVEALDDTTGKWEFTGAVDPTEVEQVMAALQRQADLAPVVTQPVHGDEEGWV